MTASLRNLALALATACGFVALVPSCADNNQTIFIRQFQQAVPPDCTLTNDPTARQVNGGSVDIGVTNSYVIYPLLGNQLIARGDPKQAKTEPNRVQIQGAQVELKKIDDTPFADIQPFSVLANGTIDPAQATDPSYGLTTVELIPPALAGQIRRALGTFGASVSLKATIKIFGKTLGNRDVETGPVVYPLDVCLGCSVYVPAAAVVPDGTRNCNAPMMSSATTTKTVCGLGQDVPTDCRFCVGNTAVCRPCQADKDCAGLASIVAPPKGATCNVAAGFCQ